MKELIELAYQLRDRKPEYYITNSARENGKVVGYNEDNNCLIMEIGNSPIFNSWPDLGESDIIISEGDFKSSYFIYLLSSEIKKTPNMKIVPRRDEIFEISGKKISAIPTVYKPPVSCNLCCLERDEVDCERFNCWKGSVYFKEYKSTIEEVSVEGLFILKHPIKIYAPICKE